MKRYSDMNDFVKSMTTGLECDMKLLSITTGVVEAGMTTREAIDEQLDIVFDEVLKFNPLLFNSRQRLEKSLRVIGECWLSKLEKE